jgi:hypothetical protein
MSHHHLHIKRGIICLSILLLLTATIFISTSWHETKDGSNKDECKSDFKQMVSRSAQNLSREYRKNAIAFLYGEQILDLASKIAMLDTHFCDDMSTDIIIFHTGYPFKAHLQAVTNVTKRHVIFYNVDIAFSSFPDGFDPYFTDPNWTKRGKWNYQHMCRFWFKLVLDIPLVLEYEYLMRLDDDSKITGVWYNVFELMENKKAIYFANTEGEDSGKGLPGLMNLKTFTFYYQKKYRLTPKNPSRFVRAFDIPDHIRYYYNNFDVIKVEFFRRSEIRQWIDAVDNTYGIFKYRWGDAVLRYITTALFATSDQILLRTDFNLPYCHPC